TFVIGKVHRIVGCQRGENEYGIGCCTAFKQRQQALGAPHRKVAASKSFYDQSTNVVKRKLLQQPGIQVRINFEKEKAIIKGRRKLQTVRRLPSGLSKLNMQTNFGQGRTVG